jgi:hypothetical protein
LISGEVKKWKVDRLTAVGHCVDVGWFDQGPRKWKKSNGQWKRNRGKRRGINVKDQLCLEKNRDAGYGRREAFYHLPVLQGNLADLTPMPVASQKGKNGWLIDCRIKVFSVLESACCSSYHDMNMRA